MNTRYWTYTVKHIALDPVPAAGVHDEFLNYMKSSGKEFEAYCLREGDFKSPEEAIDHINSLFPKLPQEVLIDKRLISKEEFETWATEEAPWLLEEGRTKTSW